MLERPRDGRVDPSRTGDPVIRYCGRKLGTWKCCKVHYAMQIASGVLLLTAVILTVVEIAWGVGA